MVGTQAPQAQRDSGGPPAEPVGNYAIRIAWSDRHDTGYYPLEILRKMPVAPDDWDTYLRGEQAWPDPPTDPDD